MKLYLFIFIIFLGVGCQHIQEVPPPEKPISEEKMLTIMYDIAIINAARGYGVQKLKRIGVNPESYVFEKYNIDSLQYAQNIAFYTDDPLRYKSLVTALEQKLNQEHKVLDSIENAYQKRKDSLRVIEVKKKRKKDSIARIHGDTLKIDLKSKPILKKKSAPTLRAAKSGDLFH